MSFTYAELSLYPMNQREQILADWLVQFAWELLNKPVEEGASDE